jgi:hypothetical protein
MKMKANKYRGNSTIKNKHLSSQPEHMFNKNINTWLDSRVDTQVSISDMVFVEQPGRCWANYAKQHANYLSQNKYCRKQL